MSTAAALSSPSSTLHTPDQSIKDHVPTSATPSAPDNTAPMMPPPEVRLNGRRASNASLRGGAANANVNGGRGDDGWGSNFWVTLVDPQVRSFVPVKPWLKSY